MIAPVFFLRGRPACPALSTHMRALLASCLIAAAAITSSACGSPAPGTEQGHCLELDAGQGDGGLGACASGLTCAFISCDPGASVPDPCGLTCLDCVNKTHANERTFCP